MDPFKERPVKEEMQLVLEHSTTEKVSIFFMDLSWSDVLFTKRFNSDSRQEEELP